MRQKAENITTIIIALILSGAGFVANAEQPDRERGMRFTENRGQIADSHGNVCSNVRFVTETAGARMYFTDHGIRYVFYEPDPAVDADRRNVDGVTKAVSRGGVRMYCLDMEFVGGNPMPRIRFEDPLPGYVNYYLPHCPAGITHVKSYAKVVYQNLYENIDLVFIIREGRMKYEYRVRPGGRPGDIAMRYRGASGLALLPGGAMEVHSPLGHIEEARPYTYESDGREVQSSYRLQDDVLSFDIGPYHTGRTLVIDPWSTYFGGSQYEVATSVACDATGNVYVAGATQSADFPLSTGAVQGALAGSDDAFVAKFSPGGTLIWATYYGGSLSESLNRGIPQIALDNSGHVYLGGGTASTDFPVTQSAFQSTAPGGGYDGYLVKLTTHGARVWATYFGGEGVDEILALAVDSEDNVLPTGYTNSRAFPTTPGAFQTKLSSGKSADAFIAKFSPAGLPVWATLYGGRQDELGEGIAVNSADEVLVSGRTNGDQFPVTPGAFQTSYGGANDGFLIALTSTGGRKWASYLGGSGDELEVHVAVDGNDEVLLCGTTSSLDFPVTNGGTQTTHGGGGTDAFVTKFSGSGIQIWGTYYGGSDMESTAHVSVDAFNNALLLIETASTNMPVSGSAFQSTPAGDIEPYLVKLDANGSQNWATYFGGSAYERALSVATDNTGNVHFAGLTASADFPVYNAYQSTLNLNGDSYLVQLTPDGQLPGFNAPPVANAAASPDAGLVPLAVTFDGASSYDPDGYIADWYWDFGDGSFSTQVNPSHTYTGAGTFEATLTVTDNDGASASTVQKITPYSVSNYVVVETMNVVRKSLNKKFDIGQAEIQILDNAQQPVSGAVVSASFSGPSNGTVSGVTDVSGIAIVSSDRGDALQPWCFTITGVQAAGYFFDASSSVTHACESSPKAISALPESAQLSVNPNPVSDHASLSFTLAEAGQIVLIVYDAVGREVATLTEGYYPEGTHRRLFDAAERARGTYFCRLYAGGEIVTVKLLLQ